MIVWASLHLHKALAWGLSAAERTIRENCRQILALFIFKSSYLTSLFLQQIIPLNSYCEKFITASPYYHFHPLLCTRKELFEIQKWKI